MELFHQQGHHCKLKRKYWLHLSGFLPFHLLNFGFKVPLTSNFAIIFLALAHLPSKRSLPLLMVEYKGVDGHMLFLSSCWRHSKDLVLIFSSCLTLAGLEPSCLLLGGKSTAMNLHPSKLALTSSKFSWSVEFLHCVNKRTKFCCTPWNTFWKKF